MTVFDQLRTDHEDTRQHDREGPPSPPPAGAAGGPDVSSDPDRQQRASDESWRIDAGKRYLLTNRTPYKIVVQHDSDDFGELVIPPFAERVVAGARLEPFDRHLRSHRQRHEVRVRPYIESRDHGSLLIRAIWVALLALAIVVGIDVLSVGSLYRTEFYVTSAIAGVVVLVGLAAAALNERDRRRRERAADSVEGNIAFGVGGAYTNGNETFRRASHLVTFGLVVLVGAVVPVVAIIVATDTKTFLSFDSGLHVISGSESRFIARLIQMTYTAVLSLFPALLFFQFDRHRVGTIRGQWVRSIFRMDRRMRTMADLHAMYGDEISEASNYSADSVRFLGGKHSPIVVATLLIMLGWTLLVIRTESFDFAASTQLTQQVQLADEAAADAADAADQAAASSDVVAQEAAATVAEEALETANGAQAEAADIAELSNQAEDGLPAETLPAVNVGDAVDQAQANAELADAAAETARSRQLEVQSTSFFQILSPSPSAAAMAFLGAYFFGVYLVLRSYFRGDLRPKVYNQITARLVTVVVLAYLLTTLLADRFDDDAGIWVLAFLAGVVPTTVLRRLLLLAGSVSKTSAFRRFVPDAVEQAFSPSRPLTQIDGVDLYDAGRLETEGIPDVPALASSELVSVMVNTRLPIGRLIDWADQAVLMVVLSTGNEEHLDARIVALRSHGIRTATDFRDHCDTHDGASAMVRACLAAHPDVDRLSHAASGHEQRATSSCPAMTADDVCRAIARQPVWTQICAWRNSPLGQIDGPAVALPAFDPAA